jgi:hypothetical protein
MVRCQLCGCAQEQAWPRISDESRDEFSDFGFSFDANRLSKAITAGCRACALLGEGIEHFQPLEKLVNPPGGLMYFCNGRTSDGAWLVGLKEEPDSKLVLEFVESKGEKF